MRVFSGYYVPSGSSYGWWLFCQSFVVTFTWTRGRHCHASDPHLGKAFPFSWIWDIGVLDMAVPISIAHIPQDFTCPSHCFLFKMESTSSKVLVGGSTLPHNATVPSVPQFQKLWYPLKCWLEVITHKWKRSLFQVAGHPRRSISSLPATLLTWPSCCCPLLSLLDKPSLALTVGVCILVQTHFRTGQKVALQFWQDQQVKQWLEA